MKNGKALKLLAAEIQQTIKEASEYSNLQNASNTLLENLGLTQKVIAYLMPNALSGNYERFLADATIFMDFFSTIVIGWQWLKTAVAAQVALDNSNTTQTSSFYEGKIHTMKFYYLYEMTKTKSLAKIIMNDEQLTITATKDLF